MRKRVRTPDLDDRIASRGKRGAIADIGRGAATSTTIASASWRGTRRAHRVGRSRGKTHDRSAIGLGRHHGAVVLCQVERRGDMARGDRVAEPGDRDRARSASAALRRARSRAQEPDAAEMMRQRDGRLGHSSARIARARSVARVERREHAAIAPRAAPYRDPPGRSRMPASSNGMIGRAIVIMPAFEHEDRTSHSVARSGASRRRGQRGAVAADANAATRASPRR